jgi:hypothetical protein
MSEASAACWQYVYKGVSKSSESVIGKRRLANLQANETVLLL